MRWREAAALAALQVFLAPCAASASPPSLPDDGAGRRPTPARRVPGVKVVLEPPYKLGSMPAASDGTTVLDPRWNVGGLGTPARPVPPPEGHPEPRVIVDLSSSEGPHEPKDIQRLARRNFWSHAIRCYRLAAYRSPKLAGWTHATVAIASTGDVTASELAQTELAEPEVAECLVERLRTLRFPEADAGSSARLAIRLGPGDDPLPPPEERVVAGPGTLSPEALARGMRAGMDRFRDCYRAGLAYAPELWGRIALRLRIAGDGTVDEAFEAGSLFPDARVRQCVLRAARKLHFPRPEGGELRVVAPLRFHSQRSRHAPAPPLARRTSSPEAPAAKALPKQAPSRRTRERWTRPGGRR